MTRQLLAVMRRIHLYMMKKRTLDLEQDIMVGPSLLEQVIVIGPSYTVHAIGVIIPWYPTSKLH